MAGPATLLLPRGSSQNSFNVPLVNISAGDMHNAREQASSIPKTGTNSPLAPWDAFVFCKDNLSVS